MPFFKPVIFTYYRKKLIFLIKTVGQVNLLKGLSRSYSFSIPYNTRKYELTELIDQFRIWFHPKSKNRRVIEKMYISFINVSTYF